METLDRQVEERVWRRVRGEEADPRPEQGLLALIAHEWADAAAYLQLSRRLPGRDSLLLREMAQQEQAHGACLKGLYTMLTGQRPTVRSVPVKQENVEAALRRCYGREMQSLALYEARCDDPQYGAVFAHLAKQEREHCHKLLEILGRLK